MPSIVKIIFIEKRFTIVSESSALETTKNEHQTALRHVEKYVMQFNHVLLKFFRSEKKILLQNLLTFFSFSVAETVQFSPFFEFKTEDKGMHSYFTISYFDQRM